MTDLSTIAAELSEAKALVEDLTDNWNAFCDADPLPHPRDYEFPDNLEAAGYVELVPVDDDALDDAFAWERGIRPGGLMWRLTPLGIALRSHVSGGTNTGGEG